MAKRHEDRQPGERFRRDAGPGKGGGGDRPRPPGAFRPGSKRPGGSRPGGSRPGGSRPGGSRPGGSRPGGSRPDAPRNDGPRSEGPRPELRRPVRVSKRRAQGLVVTPAGAPDAGPKDGKVRLNHFLAMSGVCSRRAADALIKGGRVEVNGELVRELGVRVDPEHDDVRFDGSRVQPERPTYVLFNKPSGVVCTNARHEQKKRVIDFLPQVKGRLFTVGRLDLDSEGLILLTNDGSFALEMTHPRFGVPKLYAIVLRGRVEQQDLDKARGGIWLAEGPTAGMNAKVERTGKDKTHLKVTLREGKNREIRRVFAKLGFPVLELKRIRIGDLNLHGLKPGMWRFLQKHEVAELRAVARQKDDVKRYEGAES
jgi:23S rRNA pseudouridine2605 synthase